RCLEQISFCRRAEIERLRRNKHAHFRPRNLAWIVSALNAELTVMKRSAKSLKCKHLRCRVYLSLRESYLLLVLPKLIRGVLQKSILRSSDFDQQIAVSSQKIGQHI